MVVLQCSKEDCDWKTPDRDATLAAVLAAELSNHTAVAHARPNAPSDHEYVNKKCPAIERPKISAGGGIKVHVLKEVGSFQIWL